MKKIYLAGGCFWGLEAYMEKIEGVLDAVSGYANGTKENPTYEQVCTGTTGHAETVMVSYDETKISLTDIIRYYLRVVDPISINKQGNDRGDQYRTGIYYTDESDKEAIEQVIDSIRPDYQKPIAIEVQPLQNFYMAEDYHQDYLQKNPNGYCHINLDLAEEPLETVASSKQYSKPSQAELKERLTDLQYKVTQHAATEAPFQNEYHDQYEKGIYVDIVTGEPLFASTDKFDAGCGWPSFSKPIHEESIEYIQDNSLGMSRTETKSKAGDSHLGHVFNDGPKEAGGRRFCINSASIRFVPYEKMFEEGYAEYKQYVE